MHTTRHWPAYIPPREDELFSSWLMRLAREHYCKTYSFSRFYFDSQPVWNRDIDAVAPINLINRILEYSPLSEDEIKAMFLHSYEGTLSLKINPNGFSPGILKLGLYHRTRKLYGQLCCPSCLGSETLYYRKNWRLASSLICLKCKCYLIDRCPDCQSPISFHRLESGHKNEILKLTLDRCSTCLTSLTNDIKPVKNKKLLAYQQLMDSTIENGFNHISQYSFLFFPVLFGLATKLISTSKIMLKFREPYFDYFGSKLQIASHSLYDCSLQQRTQVMLEMYKLLENWPINLDSFLRETKTARSYILKDIWVPGVSRFPFWIDKHLIR